ncbi:MAG: hypothetical protein NZ937_08790 [Armatimonadetes bacterium]|nr:hypothetical protein [Armatimonadota bacterium]
MAYDWDGNGNMVARTEGNQTTQFEYDFDNRLVKITYPDGRVVRFGYDGLGRRVWRQDGSVVRQFYFDGDLIIAEREGSAWVVRYLLGLRPCGFVSGGQVRIYHADRLGSIRWVTDGSQNIVASYVYEGFGKIVGQNGGGPYQFCGLWGYRNDGDAGLMHVGARYYEFGTGRWVQKDPMIGDFLKPQSLNKYSYARNNPLNLIDPNGFDGKPPNWWDEFKSLCKRVWLRVVVISACIITVEDLYNEIVNPRPPNYIHDVPRVIVSISLIAVGVGIGGIVGGVAIVVAGISFIFHFAKTLENLSD